MISFAFLIFSSSQALIVNKKAAYTKAQTANNHKTDAIFIIHPITTPLNQSFRSRFHSFWTKTFESDKHSFIEYEIVSDDSGSNVEQSATETSTKTKKLETNKTRIISIFFIFFS